MNPFRSPLLRGYLLSILGLIVILVSYFLPFFEGKCNELSICGPGPSLRSDIFSQFQFIHTFGDFYNSLIFLLLTSIPVIIAFILLILEYLFIYTKYQIILNISFIIWTVGFIEFILFSLFMWIFAAYPLFGFWGIVLGYGILFYVYRIFLSAHKKKEQEPAQG